MRRTLFTYLFQQVAVPSLFFTVAITMMIWLTQSLKMLSLVVNGGQSLITFFHLIFLVLPSLLAVILPIALFCGVLYGLHRLHSDSEVTVMWSAGWSHWTLSAPILTLAILVTVLNLILSLYLMPLGYRTMKDRIYEIRSDLAASFIREGQFTTKVDGLTVYIASAPSRGDLKGILVHDNRDQSRPRTYMAERGIFVKTPEGPRLVMNNGEVQEMANRDGKIQVLRFDSTVLDLGQFEEAAGPHSRDLSERYMHELFNPPEGDALSEVRRMRLIAEAHNRLASPLYNIAFALIAFIAVVCGQFSRRGYAIRMVTAMVTIIVLRALGFAVQSAASEGPAWNLVQYALPGVASVVAMLLILRVPPFDRARLPDISDRLGRLLAPGKDAAEPVAGGGER